MEDTTHREEACMEGKMHDLESTQRAAEAVGLSPWYLYRNADKIPAAYRAGRALRWDVAALKDWMSTEATEAVGVFVSYQAVRYNEGG